jgi:hypothetical protein
MATKFHEIRVVVEIRSLDHESVTLLRAVVASISSTSLEMTQAQATRAVEAIRTDLFETAKAVIEAKAVGRGMRA